MYGQDFVFNGRSLSEFGMRMVNIDDLEDDTFSLNRELISTELSSNKSFINILGAKYTDTLSFQIAIMKDICENRTQDEMLISRSELRAIITWLTGTSTASIFQLIDDDDTFDEYIEYDCICTNIDPFLIGNTLYGLLITFTCNAPYGYTKKKTDIYYETTTNSKIININYYNDSDIWDSDYYPERVIINGRSSASNVEIINNTTNKNYQLNISKFTTLIIDPKRKLLFKDISQPPISLASISKTKINNIYNTNVAFSFFWFNMHHGFNNITIKGDIQKVIIESRFPRKVGVF